MQIRPAQSTDAPMLTAVAHAAKRHWGYPESWIEEWRAALSITPASIAADETHVAIVENRIVGFFALHRVDGQLELSHLWVAPEMMSRGIGRSLFTHAIERARGLGFRQLRIEADPNAEGFYFHLGARRVGTNTARVAGQIRELPVLVYELEPAS